MVPNCQASGIFDLWALTLSWLTLAMPRDRRLGREAQKCWKFFSEISAGISSILFWLIAAIGYLLCVHNCDIELLAKVLVIGKRTNPWLAGTISLSRNDTPRAMPDILLPLIWYSTWVDFGGPLFLETTHSPYKRQTSFSWKGTKMSIIPPSSTRDNTEVLRRAIGGRCCCCLLWFKWASLPHWTAGKYGVLVFWAWVSLVLGHISKMISVPRWSKMVLGSCLKLNKNYWQLGSTANIPRGFDLAWYV